MDEIVPLVYKPDDIDLEDEGSTYRELKKNQREQNKQKRKI